MSKFALAIVVDAEDADKAWEEMGQVAGGTYDEFDMAFLGDPFPIAEQDTYDSGQAAHAILSGVSQLRDGLPVEAGAMSTSDGLGGDPEATGPTQQAMLNIRQMLREELTPAQLRRAVTAELEKTGYLV